MHIYMFSKLPPSLSPSKLLYKVIFFKELFHFSECVCVYLCMLTYTSYLFSYNVFVFFETGSSFMLYKYKPRLCELSYFCFILFFLGINLECTLYQFFFFDPKYYFIVQMDDFLKSFTH